MVRYHNFGNGVRVQFTAEEETARDTEEKAWNDGNATRKLAQIRLIRNTKLSETDWQVTSAKEQGTNLSTSFKNWRQGLRDIPSTYTTESEYDELLARDDDGNLTHSVWSE
jgi:hypothetical protein